MATQPARYLGDADRELAIHRGTPVHLLRWCCGCGDSVVAEEVSLPARPVILCETCQN